MGEDIDALDPDERVELRVPLADGDLVVTDRRAFRLLDGGTTIAGVQRDDVVAVGVSNLQRDQLGRAIGVYLLAMMALGGAVVLHPFSLSVPIDPEAAARMGVGDVVGLFQSVLDLLSLVDEALAVAGALLVVYTVVYLVRSWERTLVLERSDGRRVTLSAPSLTDADVEQLRELLAE